MAFQILQLSDLHVGRKKKEGKNLDIVVEKIVKKWGNKKEKPVILITGDIVDDGEKSQFIDARKRLEPLYANYFKVLVVPGNHDYGWNGNHARESRFKYLKSQFFPFENVSYPYPKEIGGHIFIGLNSMKAETGFFDGLLADGELGNKQINNTIGILKKAANRKPEQKVIVYLHHHPFLYPDDKFLKKTGEKIGHWLKDGEDLMHKISGQVDILLFGHEHRHLDFSGTQISTKYRIPIILSGGKTTDEDSKEFNVLKTGKAGKKILNKGLMANLITIQDIGSIDVDTVCF